MEYLIREYEAYYNTVRPHQGTENRTIGTTMLSPPGSSPPAPNEIECDSRLGGLLRHYYRKSA